VQRWDIGRGRGERLIKSSSEDVDYLLRSIGSQLRNFSSDAIRWDEKTGLRRDAVRSQVIDVLEAQIKETGNEKG
jgi:hypothetical protein